MADTTVPLQVVESSVYVLGKVNGHPCLFILDTGDAVGPVFNANDAKRLGLKATGSFQVSGAGGASTSYATEADIQLGDNIFSGESSAIDPYLSGASLLGLPFFLAKCDELSFDFVAGRLVMVSKPQAPTSVPPVQFPEGANEA